MILVENIRTIGWESEVRSTHHSHWDLLAWLIMRDAYKKMQRKSLEAIE
jgi:hypothetical protein